MFDRRNHLLPDRLVKPRIESHKVANDLLAALNRVVEGKIAAGPRTDPPYGDELVSPFV